MYQRIRKAMKDESGFTLIELLIVIVILGILAAVVVFSVQGITNRGDASACKSDVATVTTAGEAYYAKNSSYATDIATLKAGGFLHSDTADNVTYTLTGTAPNYTGFTAIGASGSACAGFTS